MSEKHVAELILKDIESGMKQMEIASKKGSGDYMVASVALLSTIMGICHGALTQIKEDDNESADRNA